MPKKKLRIAVFTDSFFPSIDGVVTSIMTTAAELSKRGHTVMVFAPRPQTMEKHPPFKGFTVVWLRAISFLAYEQYRIAPPFSFRAQKAFKEFNPDVVHCHTPFSVGWMGIHLANWERVPVIATYHTLLSEFLMYLPIPVFNQSDFARQFTWEYSKLFYKKADLVTTPSHEMVRELQKRGIPAVFVSNPLQFGLFNQFAKTKKDSKEFRLVFFGRISFEKNIDILLDALKILLDKKNPVRLVIIGSGPAQDSLEKMAQELGIEKKIEFAGVLRGEALAKKVASCHCTVTASTIETQGLTILEGMAAGLPCIGADWLAIPACVKENKTGFLFPAGKPEICAQKIEKLLKNKALLKKLSKNAIETARPYSAEKICDEWEALYSKAVQEHKKKN